MANATKERMIRSGPVRPEVYEALLKIRFIPRSWGYTHTWRVESTELKYRGRIDTLQNFEG